MKNLKLKTYHRLILNKLKETAAIDSPNKLQIAETPRNLQIQS